MRASRRQVPLRSTFGGFALLVVGVLAGNVISSLAAPSNRIITSCVDRKTGTMRYLSNGRCRSTELSVSWNVQGPTGPRGASGEEGSQGLQGPRGASGEAGNTILSGTSAPGDSLGQLGDFFINSSSNLIYGPKTAAGWPNGVSLVGPAGAAGATGATGAPGPAGNDGTAGNTLRSGSGTPASSTGSNGDFYIDTSANKIHGPKSGGNWPAGVSLVGPAGSVGATGATGAPGTTLLGSNFYVVSHYQMNGYHSASCNAGDVATGGGTSPMGANYPETNASGVPTKWTSEQDYVYAVCLDLP